ncbi:hypothetical protein DY102_00550 [Apilactobacillus timberlakei]|uniref:hypothetical protein n=1 Tax=Apilactobacillus timberlakei TaxID=2008380 RepID=UPI0011273184|nr:hypothetical protein [Apilactobacillus timberlakei]TPR24951.1 hypothetical protein DY102_00550 [Apilactobacillus timberlakei]
MDEYSEVQKDSLISLEEKTEIGICVRNIDLFEIYKYALLNNKKVIITSDMYLPINVIEKILSNNGIDVYEDIFLSSDYKLTKSSGNLFKKIKSIYSNSSILHIGDNRKADNYSAKINGIHAINIKKNNNKLSYSSKKDNLILSQFINNRLFINNNYFYNFGYECLGPLLFSYSVWLNKQLSSDCIENAFFLARDGKIMKQAFNIMYGNKYNNKYIYASRRGYIVPSLNNYDGIRDMLSNFFLEKHFNLDELIGKAGISKSDINNKYNNIDFEHNYNSIDEIMSDDNISSFLNYLYIVITNNSLKEEKLLKNYLKNKGFKGKIGIIDIGWFGHMQNALVKIFGNNIHGYYMGVKSKTPYNNLEMKGFLFDSGLNLNNEKFVRTFVGIFELLFTNLDGSFIHLYKKDNRIYPKFKNNKYSQQKLSNTIILAQKAALDFVKDYRDSYLYKFNNISMEESFSRIRRFGSTPSKKDIKEFSTIHEKSSYVLSEVNLKSKIFYLFHPKCFVNDLNHSWYGGALYNFTKIKLPYYKLYFLFKKLSK